MVIVIGDPPPPLAQKLHDIQRRGFPNIVRIFLISHPQYEDPGALDAFFRAIERLDYLLDHKSGHLPIDLISQLDQPRLTPAVSASRRGSGDPPECSDLPTRGRGRKA